MNDDIKLGRKIENLKGSWRFDKMVKFLKGENDINDTYNDYFTKLKPLYDEFGYDKVNNLIFEIADELKEEEKNE